LRFQGWADVSIAESCLTALTQRAERLIQELALKYSKPFTATVDKESLF